MHRIYKYVLDDLKISTVELLTHPSDGIKTIRSFHHRKNFNLQSLFTIDTC